MNEGERENIKREEDFLDPLPPNSMVLLEEEEGGAMTLKLSDGTQTFVPNIITTDSQTNEIEGFTVKFDDGRIGYICGNTLLKIMSEERPADPQTKTNSKFVCRFPHCFKSYSSLNHLKTHQRNHTGHRPHICTVCKKRFTTGYALKSHTRTHTGEKPYHCPEELCRKGFKTSGDLQKHIRTHTGERPFTCEICGKSFTTSNIRKVHLRVHTGEKPYECKYEGCGRRFASATNYRNHLRIHTGEKPYVCSVEKCGKRFTEYSSLYKHHMVHTQPKKYICNHCGKFYRQIQTLIIHKRTVHNIIEDDSYEEAEGDSLWVRNELSLSLPGVGAEEEEEEELEEDVVARHGPGSEREQVIVMAAPTSEDNPKTAHLASEVMVKKVDQMLPASLLTSQLTLQEDCSVGLPEVELGEVMVGGAAAVLEEDPGTLVNNLELSEDGNGSIFVFTDPSNLAAFQLEMAGEPIDDLNFGETVEIISLDEFQSLAPDTTTATTTTSSTTIVPAAPQQEPESIILKHDSLAESKGRLIVINEIGLEDSDSTSSSSSNNSNNNMSRH